MWLPFPSFSYAIETIRHCITGLNWKGGVHVLGIKHVLKLYRFRKETSEGICSVFLTIQMRKQMRPGELMGLMYSSLKAAQGWDSGTGKHHSSVSLSLSHIVFLQLFPFDKHCINQFLFFKLEHTMNNNGIKSLFLY